MNASAYFYETRKASSDSPRVLAIANQKGGVGKTTTTINLGTALAATGECVLILDIDPQGNASTGLGLERSNRQVSMYDVMKGAHLRDAILTTAVPRLMVAPSTIDLLGIDMELASEKDRATRLRNAVSKLNCDEGGTSSQEPFTYILIDCPPSLSLLTLNAMVCSDAVLVPMQCEFFAMEGLTQILRSIEKVQSSLNSRLTIHGIVLTMFDPRNNLANQVVADVREFLGNVVYQTMIPRNIRLSEAPSHGKPALLYDLKCAGSQAYLRLASEVLQREKILKAA
jgi:chromosome partitioning protein